MSYIHSGRLFLKGPFFQFTYLKVEPYLVLNTAVFTIKTTSDRKPTIKTIRMSNTKSPNLYIQKTFHFLNTLLSLVINK